MHPTVSLGSFRGIRVGLHWSIAFIAVLLGVALAGTILPTAAPGEGHLAYVAVAGLTVAAFLASIVAHELGHSLVARRSGVGVRGVTLFALGGVAALDSAPSTPRSAARIALAGPAVSAAIGIGALAAGAAGAWLGAPVLVTSAVVWLGVINLALAVFNMVPALPLDGGRVLQAFLWHRSGQRHLATIRAAAFGRAGGWLLVALGGWQFLQTGDGLWTVLIGWFVLSAAGAERDDARHQMMQSHPSHHVPVAGPVIETTEASPPRSPSPR